MSEDDKRRKAPTEFSVPKDKQPKVSPNVESKVKKGLEDKIEEEKSRRGKGENE